MGGGGGGGGGRGEAGLEHSHSVSLHFAPRASAECYTQLTTVASDSANLLDLVQGKLIVCGEKCAYMYVPARLCVGINKLWIGSVNNIRFSAEM